ncbi:hypothetical protein SS7213T_04781, partial [Staphylococcus simiae CCM 7213 = CCUG 51256]
TFIFYHEIYYVYVTIYFTEISRKDEVWEGKSGLLTIAGGK